MQGGKRGEVKAKGERLERKMWVDMKTKNWPAVEASIAKGFQSSHPDGARNRQQEIKLIEGLDLGDYTLSNFKSTHDGDNIIVTYFISVAETLDDVRTNTKPAQRMSVWKQNGKSWQWIAHANLK